MYAPANFNKLCTFIFKCRITYFWFEVMKPSTQSPKPPKTGLYPGPKSEMKS